MSKYETYVDVASLLARYWSSIENFQYAEALEFLTEDVVYLIGPGATGRSAVAALLEKRPRALTVRHLLTNFLIEPAGDTLEVRYTMAAFGRIAEEGEQRPFPPSAPSVVADMNVSMVRVGVELKISRVAADLIFQQPH